jgi:hypothetical protein
LTTVRGKRDFDIDFARLPFTRTVIAMEPELPEEETKDFRKNWDPKIICTANLVEELAKGEKKQRAATILDNYPLLMKYALANDQVSIYTWP